MQYHLKKEFIILLAIKIKVDGKDLDSLRILGPGSLPHSLRKGTYPNHLDCYSSGPLEARQGGLGMV